MPCIRNAVSMNERMKSGKKLSNKLKGRKIKSKKCESRTVVGRMTKWCNVSRDIDLVYKGYFAKLIKFE